jgi:hypothetical protein
VLSNHERMSEWMPVREVVRRRPGSPEPDGSGAVRSVRTAHFVLEEVVTLFEPGRRMELRLLEGALVRGHRGEVLLTTEGGGTGLEWSVRFEPILFGSTPIHRRLFGRMLEAGLPRLKRLVEARCELVARE